VAALAVLVAALGADEAIVGEDRVAAEAVAFAVLNQRIAALLADRQEAVVEGDAVGGGAGVGIVDRAHLQADALAGRARGDRHAEEADVAVVVLGVAHARLAVLLHADHLHALGGVDAAVAGGGHV